MNVILKCIGSWKILAPALIAVMVVWLAISSIVSLTFTKADGRVTQLIQKGSGEDTYFCPVTTFRDAAGVEHSIHSSGGSNPPRFPVGSVVTVLYRTQSPDAGMIQNRFMMWVAPLLFIGVGIFYGSIGFIVSRLLQKRVSR